MTLDDDFPVSKEILFEEINNYEAGKELKKLRLLHFNDVYNIESRKAEPCGGSPRFINLVENLIKNEPTLVFFSGDAFSPSNRNYLNDSMTHIIEGKQMAEILNHCHINSACIGNHDFDFGIETLLSLMKSCNFPWLLSNVKDAATNQPLAGALETQLIEFNGLKIGVIGIVEEEWMATLSTIDFDDVKYESYILAGKRLAQHLKKVDKVDLVIALTHMRLANDEIFTASVPEIDLFLGGHDHDYSVKQIKNRWLIKSGADFRELTLLEMEVDTNENRKNVSRIEHFFIESLVPEHENIKLIVDKYMADLNRELDVELGEMKTELDGRFSKVRSQETNLGNFICDIILEAVDADCCIINSGSLRSDTLHPAGVFKVRDLKAILPYADTLMVISVTGQQIHEALENGVSQYPKLEGRFPQLSGLRFTFDPSKPGGNRIDPSSIFVQNELIDLKKIYTMATKPYLYEGKDGYVALKNSPILVEDEYIPLLFNLVENHFKTIQKLKKDAKSRLRSSIVPLFIVNRLIKELSNDPSIVKKVITKKPDENKHISFRTAAHVILKTVKLQRLVISRNDKKVIKKTPQFKKLISEYETKSMQLAPIIDGRIICLSTQTE